MQQLSFDKADPASSEIRGLIGQLDGLLSGLYPAESRHFLSIEQLQQPNVTLLAARLDGEAVGCGAFVDHSGEYAEIKRMFVVPGCRGLGIGRRILAELESRARASGLELSRLETGVRQIRALSLYERSGYRRRGPFGSYREDPLCVFMEKRLA